jgi:hypothetical protein
MNAGDVVELITNTVCPQIAEETTHERVNYDPAVHILGGVMIYGGDVLRLVRQVDAKHWLCRVSNALLVCLNVRSFKPSEDAAL